MFVAATGIAIVSFANCVVVQDETICVAHVRFVAAVRGSLALARAMNTLESTSAPRSIRTCRTNEGYDGDVVITDHYDDEQCHP
jgi:hypothetical protein